MFSWFRRPRPAAPAHPPTSPHTGGGPAGAADRPAPPRVGENPANPGVAPRGSFKRSQTGHTRAEEFDCVQLLARLLADHGHEPRVEGDVVTDQATGLTFRPLLAAFQPIPNKGAQTISTIEVKHATLIPSPVFEFQHSTGDTPLASIQSGFDQWCKTDLPALADATRPEPRHCTIMKFASEAKGDRPAIKRRLVLGPVAHVQQHPPDAPGGQEEHPFCPCCLLTRSWEAFRPQIESPGLLCAAPLRHAQRPRPARRRLPSQRRRLHPGQGVSGAIRHHLARRRLRAPKAVCRDPGRAVNRWDARGRRAK
jgi:hypothetical protein